MNMKKWEIIEQVNSLLTAIPDSDPTQLEKDYVNLLANYNKLFAEKKSLEVRMLKMKSLLDTHHVAMQEVFEGAKDDQGMNQDPAFYKNALANPVSGWISVKDRLPEKGARVLVFRPRGMLGGDNKVTIAEYTRFIYSSKAHGWSCYSYPSHWMPLPAAPEAEE